MHSPGEARGLATSEFGRLSPLLTALLLVRRFFFY